MLRNTCLSPGRFKDELIYKGWAVGQSISEHVLKLLDACVINPIATENNALIYSFFQLNANKHHQLSAEIHHLLLDELSKYAHTFKILNGSYIIKPSNTSSHFHLHQDWSYTDEMVHSVYNVWIPLQDITLQNGALYFLSGSQVFQKIKRSGSYPTLRIPWPVEEGLEIVRVPRGTMVWFHPAVFHGSMPNQTSEPRKIITATVMPLDAPFLYYHRFSEQEASIFAMEEDAFIDDLGELSSGMTPKGIAIKHISYVHQPPDYDELKAWQQKANMH